MELRRECLEMDPRKLNTVENVDKLGFERVVCKGVYDKQRSIYVWVQSLDPWLKGLKMDSMSLHLFCQSLMNQIGNYFSLFHDQTKLTTSWCESLVACIFIWCLLMCLDPIYCFPNYLQLIKALIRLSCNYCRFSVFVHFAFDSILKNSHTNKPNCLSFCH